MNEVDIEKRNETEIEKRFDKENIWKGKLEKKLKYIKIKKFEW